MADKPGLLGWFISNPIAANLLMVVLVIGGLYNIPGLDKQFFPTPVVDRISIAMPFPGASPREGGSNHGRLRAGGENTHPGWPMGTRRAAHRGPPPERAWLVNQPPKPGMPVRRIHWHWAELMVPTSPALM